MGQQDTRDCVWLDSAHLRDSPMAITSPPPQSCSQLHAGLVENSCLKTLNTAQHLLMENPKENFPLDVSESN